MSSRFPCKHELAKRKNKKFKPVPLNELVMGPTPHCLECAREAGKKLVENLKKDGIIK